MQPNLKKASLFVGLTFLVSWPLSIAHFATGGKLTGFPWLAASTAFMFVPMTAALVVQKLVYRLPVREPLGVSFRWNRWFLFAWILPAGIVFAAIAASLLFPGVALSDDPVNSRLFDQYRSMLAPEEVQVMEKQFAAAPFDPFWMGLLSGLVAGITVNAVAGFGEELGWRGLLQRELAALGFWRSSALIGIVWGVWHAPLVYGGYNYPDHPIAGVLMMTALCVLLSPIFAFIRLKANSVIAASILHGTFNATAVLPMLALQGDSELTAGILGFPGLLVLAGINLALFLFGGDLPSKMGTRGESRESRHKRAGS